jgi:predicted PurR-regulated permease PerM
VVDRSVGFPRWFQRLGLGAWLIVGMVLVLAGAVWLLAKTETIVGPLICGAVIATVGGAVVDILERHRVPRVLGAALMLLALIVLGAVIAGLVFGGISSQAAHIDGFTSQAVDRIRGWAEDLGISSASDVASDVKKAVPDIGHALLNGVIGAVAGLKSVLVFLGFTIFTTFFLLKDGPMMGRWIERHMGMKPAEARIVTGDLVHALRQYFVGLTIVGLFNAVLVGLGALALGVPLPGTIAVVTFVASYVPIVGAWTAGGFAFLLALADKGSSTAWIMALIVFLANGPLQQIVQPIAYGATLQLNPLVVFSVTIAAGTLFGMVGLILGAPLVSAAVHIHGDLAKLKQAPSDGEPPGDTLMPDMAPPAPPPEVQPSASP